MAEDRRAVLAAEVQALAVASGGIVDPPERLEQLRVADPGRVEPHLDRLGVTGAVPADPLVAGVRDVAAGVARSSLQYPVDLAEGRLHTPEASRGESGALGSVWSVSLEWRRRVGIAVVELDHVLAPLKLLCQHEARAGDSCRTARGGAAPSRVRAAHGARAGISWPLVRASAAQTRRAAVRCTVVEPDRVRWLRQAWRHNPAGHGNQTVHGQSEREQRRIAGRASRRGADPAGR